MAEVTYRREVYFGFWFQKDRLGGRAAITENGNGSWRRKLRNHILNYQHESESKHDVKRNYKHPEPAPRPISSSKTLPTKGSTCSPISDIP